MLDQEFRSLFEAVGDTMVLVDGNQQIVLVNQEAEAVFGYSVSEMIGEPLTMLIPASFGPKHGDHFRGFIEGDATRQLMSTRPELRGLRKAGDEFPVEITLAKINVENGVLIVAIVRDTTERHRTEETLRTKQAELERLLESKDDLIASVSHEIRTPLTSIVGFARLLHDSSANLPESERREMVEILIQQSGDLTNIVEDLLAVAKVEQGKLEVSRVSVDLRAQAAQVLEMWEPRAAQQVRFKGQTVRCVGDPARVRQIIRNLVMNASRYGGPEIRVETGTRPERGFVLVADDGPGIPEELRETIFEAYGRGRDLPGLAPSLGLGLYISRTLARLMQGEVTYWYQDGESVFELSLPHAVPPDTT